MSQMIRSSSGARYLFGLAAVLLLHAAPALAVSAPTIATRILGQPNFTSRVPNAVEGDSLNLPAAVAIDTGVSPNRLYVSDTQNSRVLVYNSVAALANGAPADLVIGQPNLFTSGCNSTGITSSSLCTPGTLAIDSAGHLFVADNGNSRVLVYNRPAASSPAAFAVFGQGGNFTSNACNLGGGPSAETLCNPNGVAVDSKGNVYISDDGNNRVVEFNSPLAVTATPGSGDAVADLEFGQGSGATLGQDFSDHACNQGGPAGAITLCNPTDVAVDSKGNVYVADFNNSRVLEYNNPLTPNTTATMEFGQGAGHDFIDNSCNNGGVTASSLCHPAYVALDAANNVYIGDYDNNRMLEYNNPLGGNGAANRVFGQNSNFTASSCNLGAGQANPAATTLCKAGHPAVDSGGNLYAPDQNNSRVLKFNTPLTTDTNADAVLGQDDFNHSQVNTIDPSGLNTPDSLAFDLTSSPNHLWVVDLNNSRVLGYKNGVTFLNNAPADIVIGQPNFFTGSCNSIGVNAASLCNPAGVAVDSAGNLYVSDDGNHRVLEYNTPFVKNAVPGSGDGIADNVFGQGGDFTSNSCNLGGGPGPDTLCSPNGVAIDPNGSLWVADQGNHRVLQYYSPLFNNSATFVIGQPDFVSNAANRGGPVGPTTLDNPTGVALDSAGNLYVADFSNNRVLEFNSPLLTDAIADREFGQGTGSNLGKDFTDNTCDFGNVVSATTLCNPNDVAVDANNNLYVVDYANNRTLQYVGPLAGGTGLAGAVTARRVFGQADNFTSNSCNFGSTTQASAASQCRPTGVAVSGAPFLDVLVADRDNNRVIDYDPPHFSPRSVSFGTTSIGVPVTRTLYLVNTQGVWLNKLAISLSGAAQFTIAKNACGASLAPHSQCAVTVAFKAATTSLVGATLIAKDDATNSPQRAALSGRGASPTAPRVMRPPSGR